jgi:Acetyltransferase (GNAT) domain
MPGMRHEPATAPARVTTRRGWSAVCPLEPALEALHRTAATPVTARLAWWRAAVAADPGAVPLLLALRGHGGTITAATLVALRDEDGDPRITSVRPHTDDVWDIGATSAGARQLLLAGLARYAAGLGGRWRLTLTGIRDAGEATWLARRLPGGRAVPAPPVPGIGLTGDEVPLAPGIRSGLDRSGHRIRRHALAETIRFEREPGRLRRLRDEIEAVHQARDHDAGRVSDLDDRAGLAFWRSVYDGHAARGELEVATLRLDGHLAAYVVALVDSSAYRVFDGRFAPKWRLYSPGRRLEAAVVEHARRGRFLELDWMSSVAPEKLVASTQADPRWAVTAAGDQRPALPGAGGGSLSVAAP